MSLSRKAQEAIKTALAMTIAYGIALRMGWDKPMWAGFAVAFVSLSTVGQSLNKAALRMVGTLAAVVVALTLIALFAQDRWLFMLFLSAWVGLCTYMMSGTRAQYFWNVGGFVCVVICMDAGPNSIDAFALAMARAEETGMGILVYSLVALSLWPISSRDDFAAAASGLASTQRQLHRAYLGLMCGQGTAEAAQQLGAQEAQAQTRFGQLLAAAETDSPEVGESRRQWRSYRRQSAQLTATMERWRESLADVQPLDPQRLLPDLTALGDELDQRFAQIERMLAGQAPERRPADIDPAQDDVEVRALSHFDRAAWAVTRSQLQSLEELTRSLFDTIADIKGFGPLGTASVAAPPPRAGFAVDPDRAAFAVRLVATMWLAFLAAIYVSDLPGGFGLVTFSGPFGMALATMPQVPVSALFFPAAFGVLSAGLLYIFVMPQLSSFVGLGLLIFAATFGICYLFSAPRQMLGRAFGLAMFIVIASISNDQTYSFLSVADTALMLPLIFLVLVITAYFPISWRPERVFLRMLGRLFGSCEYLVSSMHRDPRRSATRWERWRTAFHVREVSTLPAKLATWAPHIDSKALAGTSADVQALVTSLQALAARMQELLAARDNPQAPLLVQELEADIRAWRVSVQAGFRRLAEDPASGEPEAFRATLVAIMGRVEARIRELLDKAAEGQFSAQDAKNFYSLLGGYRGVSDAMVQYAGSADVVDWSRWREEAY